MAEERTLRVVLNYVHTHGELRGRVPQRIAVSEEPSVSFVSEILGLSTKYHFRTRIPPVSVIAPPHLYALPRILPPPGPKIGRLSIKSVKGEHRGWLASGHRKSGKCPLTSEYRKALVVTYAPGKTPGTFNIIVSTAQCCK